MDKRKKLNWIYKFTPWLYNLAIILCCTYVGVKIRLWLNMVFKAETAIPVIIVSAIMIIGGFTVGKHCLVAKNKFLTYIAGFSAFISIYLFMFFLILDLSTLILKIFIKNSLFFDNFFLYGGFLCLGIVLFLTIYGFIKVQNIKTVNYEVKIKGFNEQYRIVLLSDLHIGHYIGARHIKKVVQAVNNLRGDIVLISGDLINYKNTNECNEISTVSQILSELNSKEGTFAVVGNHDPDALDPEFQRFLKDSNIYLLEDDIYSNDKLHILGRTTKLKPRMSIKQMKEKIHDNLPIFIMDHDPMGIKEAIDEDADLIMCGHTHKGQVFPFNLFVRFLYNKSEAYGISKSGKTYSVVSAGTGYFSMPMRLGSDCEVICIDIKGY